MLKRVLQSTLAAAALSAFPVFAAHASEVCTTGSLAVCVTFNLSSIGTDTYELRVDFTGSNAGGSLYEIGILDGSGNPFAINGVGDLSTGNIGGSASTNLNWDFGCNGLPNLNLCAEGPTGGGAVAPGQFVEFDFTTNAALDQNVIEQAHIQAFPNLPDCSVKVSTASSGGPPGFTSPGLSGGSFNADATSCDVVPTSSTPEPASLWLMGTGLLGLGGVGAFRRRRR